MTLHTCSTLIERAGGGAPTAFRIWPAGTVDTDLGTFLNTERTAELLTQEQTERGVKYPFDLDHLSLNSAAPISTRAAVGWHALAIRNGEIWAVDCEWSAEARRALEQRPPAFRYYSPVFVADEKTQEITRYIGCALTNTPATHQPTDLAIAASRLAQHAHTAPKDPMLSSQDDQKIYAALVRSYGAAIADQVMTTARRAAAGLPTAPAPDSTEARIAAMSPAMRIAFDFERREEFKNTASVHYPSLGK